MGALKYKTPDPQHEPQQEFFLLDADCWIWSWAVGGIVFLLLVILLTGYIDG